MPSIRGDNRFTLMTNYQDSCRFMNGTSTTEPISLRSQKSAYDREIEGTRYEVTPSKKKTPMAARQIDRVKKKTRDTEEQL